MPKPIIIRNLTFKIWGAAGGSRSSPPATGGMGAYTEYHAGYPAGAVLTLIVGGAGGNGAGAGGGGLSGLFLGTISQSNAVAVAGGGGGAAGDYLVGKPGGAGIGTTGQFYSGGPLQGGINPDGGLTGTAGYGYGGAGYETGGKRSVGGGGGGCVGGSAGYVYPNGGLGMGSQSGYGGSCYVRTDSYGDGSYAAASASSPGNDSDADRGNAGSVGYHGKIVFYKDNVLVQNWTTPGTYTLTIT